MKRREFLGLEATDPCGDGVFRDEERLFRGRWRAVDLLSKSESPRVRMAAAIALSETSDIEQRGYLDVVSRLSLESDLEVRMTLLESMLESEPPAELAWGSVRTALAPLICQMMSSLRADLI